MVSKIFKDTDFKDAEFMDIDNIDSAFQETQPIVWDDEKRAWVDDVMPTIGEVFSLEARLITLFLIGTIFGVCFFFGSVSL